jgi:hypothetical protein
LPELECTARASIIASAKFAIEMIEFDDRSDMTNIGLLQDFLA